MITEIIRRSLILLPCLHRLNFLIIKLRTDPKPTTWIFDYIDFFIIIFLFLLVGPWPWAPHQKNEYNIHLQTQITYRCIRGTLQYSQEQHMNFSDVEDVAHHPKEILSSHTPFPGMWWRAHDFSFSSARPSFPQLPLSLFKEILIHFPGAKWQKYISTCLSSLIT